MAKLPSASLYVGDLLPAVDETCLFDAFKLWGFGEKDIATIKVCRDTFKPHRSLGYAYVNFYEPHRAETALDHMNNQPILNKPCRIMWSQRDPSLRKSGVGNIFIKNLDKSVTHKDLYDNFSTCGNILSCKVALNSKNESKGFGFVHFEKAEDAQKAIDMHNGTLFRGKEIFVGPFLSKKERMQQTESSWTNVYIKNLSLEIDDEQLKSKFEQFGPVSSVLVQRDPTSNVSKGFGFVNFVNHEDAKRAVESLNGTTWMDKEIWCGRHMTQSEREPEILRRKKQRNTMYQGINLYIKNLDDDIDDARLEKEFSIFGEIKKLKVVTDPVTGQSKQFGFICFKTPEAAEKAKHALNNQYLTGGTKPLYINYHEPKEVRVEKLSQQFAYSNNRKRVPFAPPYSYHYLYPPHFIRNRPQAWTQHPHNPYYPQYSVPVHNPLAQPGRPPMRNQGPRPRNQQQQGRGRNIDVPEDAGHLHPVPNPAFLNGDPEQRKYYLGDQLFPLIQELEPAVPGKITGMLLDSGISHEALYALIGDPKALAAKVKEAREVLDRAQISGGGPQILEQ